MIFLKNYEILLKKAETDYKSAKILSNSNDYDIDMEVVLFHLQQATEKYLKSVLAYKNIHFSKTHDLKTLIDMSNDVISLTEEEMETLLELNQYAVNGRYNFLSEVVENKDSYFKITEIIKVKSYEILRDKSSE